MTLVQELLKRAVEEKASDLHLTVGAPPVLRVNKELKSLTEYGPPDLDRLRAAVETVLNEQQRERFERQGDVDLSFGLAGVGRFRVNVFKQRGSPALCFRVIKSEILSFEELGLPSILADLCRLRDGLVLVTGPTGKGKSTTLASMVDFINQERSAVIITVEDPIEYLHRHKKSIVNQREVGSDTVSFAAGLRAALREDPDVILVGEMRDTETIETALRAAETGHLVFSTLHTRGAAGTIDRIVDSFPAAPATAGEGAAGRGAAGGHLAAARAPHRRRRGRRLRSDGRDAGHPQLDPGGPDAPDRLGDRDARPLRHAVHAPALERLVASGTISAELIREFSR